MRLVLPVLLLGSVYSAVAADCQPWQDSFVQQYPDLRVGAIRFDTNNVFDPELPEENRWHQRLANRLHVLTREETLAAQLLFHSGEAFDPALLAETERLLRNRKYLRRVSVMPVALCDDEVTVQVSTTDNWTLAVGLNFGREGGDNSSGMNIRENNLLGLGRDLSLDFRTGSQRSQAGIRYRDPQFRGRPRNLELELQHQSDGYLYQLGYSQPFFSLDSSEAWSMELGGERQETPQYADGSAQYDVGRQWDTLEVYRGWSSGRQDSGNVQRYRIGWHYERNRYFATDSSFSAPATHVESYPWFSYEFLQDRYTKRTNLRRIGVTEDIALGHHFTAKAGILHQGLGADANQLRLEFGYDKGFSPSAQWLGLLEVGLESYLGEGKYQGEQFRLDTEWYWFDQPRSSWLFAAGLRTANNLLPGEQILLGGDTGLRSYPNGFQDGDKSVLLRLERRYYFDWYPLRAVRVGAAAFIDTGSAWKLADEQQWLADVGVGLRLMPTRSSHGKVLHIDLAKPLVDKDGIDGWQILVTTQTAF
ncbi:MAG: BamA/TamA family outer membrane protein [Thiolinea sp.]